MNILIAGGAGFIGSHLVRHFSDEGHLIWIVDDLSSGMESRMEQYKRKTNLYVIQQNITDPIKIPAKLDMVFHFACMASPIDFFKYPIEIYLSNSMGTYNLLELSKQHKARFILASTSEIYGDPLVHPQSEAYFGNVNPVGVRSCYDEGKRFAEGLTMQYHLTHKLDTRIIRIFNTYGPGLRSNDGRVITNFINQALTSKNISVYGDGKQTRSFCYIDDMINGINAVAKIEGLDGTIMNMGNPAEISINDLVSELQTFFNYSLNVIHKELPSDDPVRRKPDISKAENLLGWHPVISLKEGLKETIQYFKNNED